MIVVRPQTLRVRAVLRLALAGLLGMALVIGSAGSASAHATLIDTDPGEGEVLATAPEQVQLTFDEPVRLQESAVRLFDASGDELEVEARTVDAEVAVTFPGEVDVGTYVVSWRVISTDGHPIAGSLTFSIGAPSEQVADVPTTGSSSGGVVAAHGVLHGLMYLGLFAAAGLVVFLVLLLPASEGLDHARRRVRNVMTIAAVVGGAAAVLLLPVSTSYQEGLGLGDVLSGRAWTAQLLGAAGLMTLLVVVGLTVAVVGTRMPTTRVSQRVVAMSGVVLALGSLALVGHTRSFGPPALVMTADVLHVAAGAVWFGGLLGLGLTLPGLAKRERTVSITLARFSSVAAGLLALLTVAGLTLSWRILRSWSALIETDFGKVLLVKVGIVGLAVGIAGWNRFGLLPRMQRADSYRERQSTSRLLRIALVTEASVVVIALLITGFLVNRTPAVLAPTPTAASSGARGDVMRGTAGDVQVIARVAPRAVGRNTILVQIQDPAGNPVEPYAVPVVTFSSSDLRVEAQQTTNIDSGTYLVRTLIPRPGQWTLQVSVRTSEFDNPVAQVDFEVQD